MIDGHVLLFTLGLSLLTGLTVGLIPALKSSRPDLTRSIKEDGGGASSGRGIRNYRSALVVAEVALAFSLLSGAGLLIQSFFKMQRATLGFDSSNLLVAHLPIAAKRFHSETEFGLYLHRILDRIDAVPGVRKAALTNGPPMRSLGFGMQFQIVGAKPVDPTHRPGCIYKSVSPSYFRTLGLTLLRGRLLNDRDTMGTTPVIVINEALAKRYFPKEDPVGKHLLVAVIPFGRLQFGPEISWEIVGVIGNERLGSVRDRLADYSALYLPEDQGLQTQFQTLVIRGSIDAQALIPAISKAVREVDPDQVLDDVQTLDEIKAESLGTDQLRTSLLAIFGAVALAQAAMGLFGVVSYSVTQRTREIGIRTALGATPANIINLVVRGGMSLTCVGLAIGWGTALGLSRLLASLLFELGKDDPVTLSTVAGTLVLATLLACLIPARRAAKVDPIIALRCE
jgi:putative ABC transport system permease protein